MFLFLNRLRGTQGLWSKIIGLLIALATLIAFHNTYVALAVGYGLFQDFVLITLIGGYYYGI